MYNLWYGGAGFNCIWSFGVAYSFKKNNIPINYAGGYSSGSLTALYSLSKDSIEPEELINKILDPVTMKNFINRYKRNLQYITENILGSPYEFNLNTYNKKIWIPIRGLTEYKSLWRNNWRSYDDLVDTVLSTCCIPLFTGNFNYCYYDDYNDYRGPTIDGFLSSPFKPKFWDKNKTISISPYGLGDINMTPRAKLINIIYYKRDDLKETFYRGFEQGNKFINLL
jgi:hypothetical protein